MSRTEAVTDDLNALINTARASVSVLDKGHMTDADLLTDVRAMQSILTRIERRVTVS